MQSDKWRTIIISNRLPVTIHDDGEHLRIEPRSGGLVTALRPLLNDSGGIWIGWTGTDESPEMERLLESRSKSTNLALLPVSMSRDEGLRFYSGFSNEVLWPLFHDLQSRCNFDPSYWETYAALNKRFAVKAASLAKPGDLIWLHDYHLMSTASCLRKLGINDRLLYFHHIPFPSPDIFEKLPWRTETLIQVVVPSREDIPKYGELKAQIERLVSQINGQFGDAGWVPIHYIHRSLERSELLAYYGAADVAFVTPLKDGMNLVSKEYCAARVHDDGVLILSEFVGSASQLHLGALLVNPNHTVEVARCLHSALGMSSLEQHARMRPMSAKIRRDNIFAWRDEFLPKL